MKASDLFIKCLEDEGVEYIFGMPGEEISAQHAIREGGTSAKNIIYEVEKSEGSKDRRVKFN